MVEAQLSLLVNDIQQIGYPTASSPKEEDITSLLKFAVHRFDHVGGADG